MIGEVSLDRFKGTSTGNHGFYHQIEGFPVNFPIIQFYESIMRNHQSVEHCLVRQYWTDCDGSTYWKSTIIKLYKLYIINRGIFPCQSYQHRHSRWSYFYTYMHIWYEYMISEYIIVYIYTIIHIYQVLMVMVVATSPVKFQKSLALSVASVRRTSDSIAVPLDPRVQQDLKACCDTAGWWINEESLGISDDPSWSF